MPTPETVITNPLLYSSNPRIQHQPNQSNHQHSGDDEVVAFAGVSRVDDEVSESGIDGDHFGGDEDDPGDAEGEAQSDDDARQDGGGHDTPHQLRRAESEVAAGLEVHRRPVAD